MSLSEQDSNTEDSHVISTTVETKLFWINLFLKTCLKILAISMNAERLHVTLNELSLALSSPSGVGIRTKGSKTAFLCFRC